MRAAKAQVAGQRGVWGGGRWAAGPSPGHAAVSVAPPWVAAAGTAAQATGTQLGGQPGAACQAVAVAACAGWQRSAPEVLWMGRTAAGFASVRSAGQSGEQEASLLQDSEGPTGTDSGAQKWRQ